MQYQFVLNILDSNTTNIVKDIIIFSTEDIQKITPGREKVLTLQKPAPVLKKNSEY